MSRPRQPQSRRCDALTGEDALPSIETEQFGRLRFHFTVPTIRVTVEICRKPRNSCRDDTTLSIVDIALHILFSVAYQRHIRLSDGSQVANQLVRPVVQLSADV